jgi:hypothetical protein
MIRLIEVQGLPPDKKKELAGYLTTKFRQAVESRTNQIDGKYRRWVDNYMGKPLEKIRTTPFYKASNFVPQLIRMHTDILTARELGLIFGTKPFWRPRTQIEGVHQDWLNHCAQWLEAVCYYDIKFYRPLDMTMFLTNKTGVCVLKAPWVEDRKFLMQGGAGTSSTEKPFDYEGVKLYPIPFDDFFPYPVTASSLEHVLIKFQRLRLAKEEVEYKSSSSQWNKEACKKLLEGNSGNRSEGSARESSASEAGIALTPDVSRPFTAVEAWFDYELQSGKRFPLVAVFNPLIADETSFLKLYHHPYSSPELDPFIDFRTMPREDLFQGYAIPEILEQSQEEQAQIHNARRDGNSISLVPGWKKKRLAEVGNPSTEWYPGKVFEVDAMDDLEMITGGSSYNDLLGEEASLMQLAERYTGISPAMQGFGAGSMQGKRGIYANSATLALLAEGNKRLDIYLKRLRDPFNKLGRLIFTSYRDFRTTGSEYAQWGEHGQILQKLFAIKEQPDYRGVFFDIAASDASANRETDRTALLLMANTMSAYYSQLMQSAQMVVSMPENTPVRELLLQVLDGAHDLASRLLFVFDVGDRNHLLPDLRKVLGGQSPPDIAKTAEQAGMPPTEEPVSEGNLRDLSRGIAAIAGGGGAGSSEAQPTNRGVV